MEGNKINIYKFCQICNEKPKNNGVHYTHYGAVCCFSCKAFFRRIIRQEYNQRRKCRFQNTCDFQDSKKPKCKKCRFEKCLKAGLNPDKVLGIEERRKYARKTTNSRYV